MRKYQRGFWNFVIPAIATVGSALLGKSGQKSTNQANVQMQQQSNEWNYRIAQEANAFNRAEAQTQRSYEMASAQQAMAYNTEEAQKNRDFQAHMANTTYRRAVGDIRAAGLNPMLAYSQGGAPAPSGTPAAAAPSPRGTAAHATTADMKAARVNNEITAMLSGAQAALQLQNMGKQNENIDADTALKKAQAERETSTAENVRTQTKNVVEQIEQTKAHAANLRQDTVYKQAQGNLTQVQEELTRIQKEVASGNVDKIDAEIALLKINTLLKKLEEPEARAMAEKFKGEWGSEVSPYLKEVLDILRALTYSRKGSR